MTLLEAFKQSCPSVGEGLRVAVSIPTADLISIKFPSGIIVTKRVREAVGHAGGVVSRELREGEEDWLTMEQAMRKDWRPA